MNKKLLRKILIFSIILFLFVVIGNETFNLNNRYRFLASIAEEYEMDSKWQGILWPAIGYPAEIKINNEGQHFLNIYVCFYQRKLNLSDSIYGKLVPINDPLPESEIPLELIKIQPVSLSEISKPGPVPSWVIEHISTPYLMVFRVPGINDLGNNRNLLYNLNITIHHHIFEKANSVLLNLRKDNNIRILVATDIHVATRWDEIENDVRRLFPKREITVYQSLNELSDFKDEDVWTSDCFLYSFVNPNRNLTTFIKKANQMYRNGDLDFIVMTGDLVDYKFKKSRQESGIEYKDTEWTLLEDIILGVYPGSERLTVPLYTIPGNHDYRLFPYKLQIYGLRHCGVADDFTMEYLKRKNEYLSIKYRLNDLDAVRINTGENHSLNFYYTTFNPFSNFAFSYRGIHCLFLDSGSDAFCDLSHIFSRRGLRFVSGLIHSIEHPSSNGLDQGQIDFLRETLTAWLDSKPILMFCHAPFFNESNANNIHKESEKSTFQLNLDTNNSRSTLTKKQILEFEKYLHELNLDFATLYQNQLPALKALCSLDNEIVTISGHVHRQTEYVLDKSNSQLQRVDSGDLCPLLSSRLFFSQGLSLGHVQRTSQEFSVPGYRMIDIVNDKIQKIHNVSLNEYPFDTVHSHIKIKSNGNPDGVTITFRKVQGFHISKDTLVHKIILQFLSKSDMKPNYITEDISIALDPNSKPIAKKVLNDSGYVVYLMPDIDELTIEIEGRPEKVKVVFLVESFQRTPQGYKSLGLKRHSHELQ